MNNDFGTKQSIGALEKAANRFAAELRQEGYDVDVDTFRSGKFSDLPSSVDLTVTNDDGVYVTETIRANGYSNVINWDQFKAHIRGELTKGE